MIDRAPQRDDWDAHWADYAEAAAHNPAQQYRRRVILKLLAEGSPPGRILDVGCGTGDLASDARRRFPGAEIVGIDVSGEGLEVARRKVPDATFLERDLLRPETPDPELSGWATHAACSEVFEHVEQPEVLLENAARYMAPGCRLVVTVPGGPMSAFDQHIGHRRHYTPEELAALFEEAGFEARRTLGAGFPFFNLYRLVVLARGRRLIDDVVGSEVDSRAARAVMALFRPLFRLNLTSSPWGWQVVGVGQLRRK